MAGKNDKYHQVKVIEHIGDLLILEIDGRRHSFAWKDLSQCLASASKQERRNLVISPSGYGIHWPDLDEDLSIDGLLGISHESADCRDFA